MMDAYGQHTRPNREALKRLLATLIVLAISAGPSWAVDFAGGRGEPNDPYQIATAEQLISIGQDPNLFDKHFVLVNDIDLDPNISPDYAFDRAIVDEFDGVLDGSGFAIRRLTVKFVAEEPYDGSGPGLFRWIGYRGEVKHLILEDAEICAINGVYAGMICAVNYGIVVGCTISGTVSGDWLAGGLAGYNGGMAFQCSASGTISAQYDAGGLVGENSGSVEECDSTCTVSGKWSGGLIGRNNGDIRDCHASGTVSGGEDAGGLVGLARGTISHCYAACQVSGTAPAKGGLVGGNSFEAVTACYFSTGPDNGVGIRLTSDQMKAPANFVGWEFWGLGNNGFRIPWFMPENGYPQLTWTVLKTIPHVRGWTVPEAAVRLEAAGVGVADIVYDYDPAVARGGVILARPRPELPPGAAVDLVVSLGAYDWTANPGTGGRNDPYLALTAGQLDCLACQTQLWDKHFRFITDLDMSWRVYEESLIGQAESSGTAFDGVFDGNGHIIRNLTFQAGWVDGNDTVTLGLFGRIGATGAVRDLGLTNLSIGGPKNEQAVAGMLCAINEGHIHECYSQGRLRWYGYLGGLVGRNAGIVENCYAQGLVQDWDGRADRKLDGGLVAENTTGTIRTCYASCSIRSSHPSGLVGLNEGGSITHALWDVEVSGATTSDGGTGLTTQELMNTQVLQSCGWGGNANWVVDEGNDYPRLIWEGRAGSLIPPS